eukprot:3620857-Alexandrium_andersonii.AAC.1
MWVSACVLIVVCASRAMRYESVRFRAALRARARQQGSVPFSLTHAGNQELNQEVRIVATGVFSRMLTRLARKLLARA